MKKGRKKRLLAFLLTFVLVFSNAGVALAAESTGTEQGKDCVVVPDGDKTVDESDITNVETTSGSAIVVDTPDTSEFKRVFKK